jgi:hypothetical protein
MTCNRDIFTFLPPIPGRGWDLTLHQHIHADFKTNSAPSPMDTRGFFHGIKQQKHENHLTPLSSSNVNLEETALTCPTY